MYSHACVFNMLRSLPCRLCRQRASRPAWQRWRRTNFLLGSPAPMAPFDDTAENSWRSWSRRCWPVSFFVSCDVSFLLLCTNCWNETSFCAESTIWKIPLSWFSCVVGVALGTVPCGVQTSCRCSTSHHRGRIALAWRPGVLQLMACLKNVRGGPRTYYASWIPCPPARNQGP